MQPLSLTIILGTLLTPLFSQAPAAKSAPPAPAAPRAFEFPTHARKVLPNGLTVFVVEDHRLPLISFSLQILGGGINVPPAKAGLAGITASLLRAGTATRTEEQISRLTDSAGGSLGASAGDDATSIGGTFMKSYADLGLELLGDITVNPKFEQEEIDRLMRQQQSGLAVQFNDAEFLAPLLASRGILGTHPYAYPDTGSPETLRSITRDDIVGFHRTHYSPARAYLAITGDITPAEAFAKAEKFLGNWKTPPPAELKLPPPPAPSAKVLILDKPGQTQTQIVIGHPGVPRNHPDYVVLTVANQVFGGSFNSRLNMKLRANEGLTYGASSGFSAYRQAGLFTASTFTRTEKTGEAVQFMMDLLKEFKANPATPEEFQEAKDFLIGTFGIGLETSSAVAARIIATAIYGLPENYWSGYRQQLQSLTREQMIEATQRFLQPGKMTIALVGNAKEFSQAMQIYGPVTVLPEKDFDVMADNLLRKKAEVVATTEGVAQAKSMVQAAIAAMGGKDKLAAIKDISSKGTLKLTTPQGTMDATAEELLVYPDKYKLVMTLGGMGQVVQATDGASAFMAQGGMVRDLPAPLAAEMKKSVATAAGVGLLLAVLDGSAEILPTAGGAVQWKKDGQEVKIVFDPQSKLIRSLHYRGMSMSGPAETEMDFADYREVEGVKLPFAETILQNGQKAGERAITERKVNSGLTADVFKKPQQ